jgi:hypothetical protein
MIDIELVKDISMFTCIGGGLFGSIAYTTTRVSKGIDRIKNNIAVKKERTKYPQAIQEEGWEKVVKIDERTYLRTYGFKRVVFDRRGQNDG